MPGRFMKWFYRATDTVKEVMAIYAITVIGSGYLYSVLEGKKFLDSLYWAVVTSMTVGYGDMYPSTLPGKLLAVSLMLFMGFVVLPVVISKMIDVLRHNPNEFTDDEQKKLQMSIIELQKEISILRNSKK